MAASHHGRNNGKRVCVGCGVDRWCPVLSLGRRDLGDHWLSCNFFIVSDPWLFYSLGCDGAIRGED